MYIKVQIPARFTLLSSETDPTPVEMGVIGTAENQFTLMELKSLNAPWIQYDKNNDHIYRPDVFSNTLPLYRNDSKIRPNKFPENYDIASISLNNLNPDKLTASQRVTTLQDELPANFMENALAYRDFQHKNINDMLDVYLNVRLRGIKPFMDWIGSQDDMFGFLNSGTLRKNDTKLDASRGGFLSLSLFQKDSENGFSLTQPVSFSQYMFKGDDAPLDQNLQGFDADYQQRMTADAPYQLSTYKFNSNQIYPLGMLYRYKSKITEDAQLLRTKEASGGSRGYGGRSANFNPPLLDWQGIGYPKLSLTKGQAELRRKPMQITFSKNTVKLVGDEYLTQIKDNFNSSVFNVQKMFSIEPSEVATYTNQMITSTLSLNSTKCYALTDYNRRYYHNPNTPISVEEIQAETSPSTPTITSPPEVETYGYAQQGWGYQLQVQESISDDSSKYGTVINHLNNKKPAWEGNGSQYYNQFWLTENDAGTMKIVEWQDDQTDIKLEYDQYAVLPETQIESRLGSTGGGPLRLNGTTLTGEELPTSTSPHWKLWEEKVKKIPDVTFRSKNFFSIFDYQTCFYNNATSTKETPRQESYLKEMLLALQNMIQQFAQYKPNRAIRKWAKQHNLPVDGDPLLSSLFKLSITDETIQEGKLKMKAVKILYTSPYYNRLGAKGYSTNFTDIATYPNWVTDLAPLYQTGSLTSEIVIVLHPDGLGVSTHEHSEIIPYIQVRNNNTLRILGERLNFFAADFSWVNDLSSRGQDYSTPLGSEKWSLLSYWTDRMYWDVNRYLTAGSNAYTRTSKIRTSNPAYTEQDAVLAAYQFLTENGIDKLNYSKVTHLRSGFTVSDPLAFPVSFKKGKLKTNSTLRYTYPFPWVSQNKYVAKTGELYLPLAHSPSFFYGSMKNYDLPTSGTFDFSKALTTDGGTHDSNHGGRISLFTTATYDPKQENNPTPDLTGTRFIEDKAEKDQLIKDISQLQLNRYNPELSQKAPSLLTQDSTVKFYNRKSSTDGKNSNEPVFEYRQQKSGSRMMKYAKDNQGYSRANRPKDYAIFADMILPFAPRTLLLETKPKNEGDATEFVLIKMGKNRSQGTYNYAPQRRNTSYIDDDISRFLQGVPSELCPETYTYYGRTLGLFNWWGSLL